MSEKIDLKKLVIDVDDELIQNGINPFVRSFHTYMIISKRFQLGNGAFFDDPIYKEIEQIYNELYRKTDLYMPNLYNGAFMFRDMFFPLNIPLIFGSPTCDPTKFLLDISDTQKRWLFNDKQSCLTFFDQVIDLMDFVYGLDDLKADNLPAKTMEWWHKAKQHLEAASAIVLNQLDKGAIIQNCCLSTELLLKGALIASIEEITDAELKKDYGHNLEKLANKAIQQLPQLNKEPLHFAVKQLPKYVDDRYNTENYTRSQLGIFLMNTQFISGEIIRQFSKRNSRADMLVTNDNINLGYRTFPQV